MVNCPTDAAALLGYGLVCPKAGAPLFTSVAPMFIFSLFGKSLQRKNKEKNPAASALAELLLFTTYSAFLFHLFIYVTSSINRACAEAKVKCSFAANQDEHLWN